jgi:ArsR family transcriptional regulator, arsenate/arsenite/antimonite-responsive transcriptional repressor
VSDPQLVAVLAALGHGLRLNLWRLLLPHGPQGLPAGTIARRMSILPSTLSFHLRQMTQAGILVQRRSSRQIIYAVNPDIMNGLIARIAMPMVSRDALSGEAGDLISQSIGQGFSRPSPADLLSTRSRSVNTETSARNAAVSVEEGVR